ncbi:Ig-like domain-containing protein, partial [Bacillus sp. FJAT-29814]|uniref:Ig-like domain-containing protein n=1 Tax=Bacillus sp. FJAT-29814 TaxID=1729688 RepID=UPI00156016E5
MEVLSPIGMVDTPLYGTSVKGEVAINGWFLDGSGVSKIEILVDGKSVGTANYGIWRPDVESAYPAYQNANSGYQFTLNTKNLTNGQHKLTVREIGNNGAVNELQSQINVQNAPALPALGSIDAP